MISPPLSFTSKQALSNWCRQMLIDDRPPLLRYAISLASVATALSVASLLPYRADPSHFTLFFIAVMVSAWYGGLGAGLLATILSALSLDYFFIAPIFSIPLYLGSLLLLCSLLLVYLYYLSRTRGTPRRDQVNINDLVGETLLLLDPIFQQHGIRVTTNLSDSLLLLHGDDASLQRVLINVLDNAVDATEEGGLLKIATCASASSDANGSGIIIEITDSGAGIPSELLPKIFDLFVTTKPSGKGTGFGLVVCQEIVKAHGGTIDIDSQVGQGTSVRIFLPTDQRLGESAPVEGTT